MNTREKIKEQLAVFSGQYGPAAIVPATVKAINNDDTIAVEFSDESTVDDARLKAVVKAGNKVLLIPKVNSIVLVGKIENSDEYVVLAVDEISEVQYIIGTVKFSVDENGFLLKKHNDTLKEIATLIIEAVEPIIILEGRQPDLVKLAQAKVKVNNLLR